MCSIDQGSMKLKRSVHLGKQKRSVRNYYDDEESDDDLAVIEKEKQ
jgi:hypothetical protein